MNTPKPQRSTPQQISRRGRSKKIAAPSWSNFNFQRKLILKGRDAAFWIRGRAQKYKTIAACIESFFLVFPPYFVSNYYQIEKFSSQIRNDWPLFAAVMDHNVAVTVMIAGIWTFFVLAISRFVINITQDRPNGWSDAPIILLSALDNVVGAKEQRFSRHLKSLREKGGQSKAKDVFGIITQPDEQIKALIQGVYSVFDSLLREQLHGKYVLKVNLATVDHDGKIKSIHFHYPSNHPVRSSIENLNHHQSAMKNAVKSKRPVIIESIYHESLKPKAKFVVTDPAREEEDGSLICNPVIHDALGVVVFVISIHVDQPGIFKHKYIQNYIELLKPFALRVKLEYSLLALKETAI